MKNYWACNKCNDVKCIIKREIKNKKEEYQYDLAPKIISDNLCVTALSFEDAEWVEVVE